MADDNMATQDSGEGYPSWIQVASFLAAMSGVFHALREQGHNTEACKMIDEQALRLADRIFRAIEADGPPAGRA